MMFTPLPTSGSSGGPIVDEDTGAVVGMVLGSQMDGSRIDGMHGWGVPAEVVFEVGCTPPNAVFESVSDLSRCLAFQVWRARSDRSPPREIGSFVFSLSLAL